MYIFIIVLSALLDIVANLLLKNQMVLRIKFGA